MIEASFHDEDKFGSTLRRDPFKHDIVKEISHQSGLKKLNLRKAKLGHLPEFKSRQLEYIDISCNDLTEVPNWVLDQPNLKFLNLGANKLRHIPDLSHLPLETLKLHKNIEVTEFPKVSKGLKSLNLFLLWKMTDIPQEVLELQLLEVFSFGVTQMKTLPDLSVLPNLKWLTLTVNQLEEIPSGICSLKNLEGLWLAKNRIKFLPDEFGELSALKKLTLYSNELTELPESFYELNVEKLNLARNPLKDRDRIRDRFKNMEFFRM